MPSINEIKCEQIISLMTLSTLNLSTFLFSQRQGGEIHTVFSTELLTSVTLGPLSMNKLWDGGHQDAATIVI